MNSSYYELTIITEPKFVDILGDFVASITDDAVEFGNDRVILRTEDSVDGVIESLKEINDSLSSPLPLDIKVEEKENIDWIQKYKDSIEPIDTGKFYIHPEWYEPMEGKINILINPALAFGSGHHATTYSCLKAISEYVKSGDEVLDVGCGSGILALASKKLGGEVDLCDTDPIAVDSAKENFELNSETYNDIWVGSVNKSSKVYDIVIANIIADVLKAISKQLKERVKEDGFLILSGILDTKENIVTDSFKDMELIDRIKKDEWITLIYKKGY